MPRRPALATASSPALQATLPKTAHVRRASLQFDRDFEELPPRVGPRAPREGRAPNAERGMCQAWDLKLRPDLPADDAVAAEQAEEKTTVAQAYRVLWLLRVMATTVKQPLGCAVSSRAFIPRAAWHVARGRAADGVVALNHAGAFCRRGEGWKVAGYSVKVQVSRKLDAELARLAAVLVPATPMAQRLEV